MKKLLLLILFVIVFIPTLVYAEEIDYTMEQYYIDAYIQKDGSMEVIETFIQKGTFNGYYRDILYRDSSLDKFNGDKESFYSSDIYNGSSLNILEVGDVSLSGKYKKFTPTLIDKNGQYGVYINTSINGGSRLKIFNPSSGDSKGYYIHYQIEDAIVIHNDIAELNWTFIGENFEDDLKDVKINVYLPGVDQNIKAWLHGPLDGDIKINQNEEESSVCAVINSINKSTPVDIRMVFDKDLLPEATKSSNVDALGLILEVEEERAAEANKIRKAVNFINGYFVIGLLLFPIISIIFYRKVKKGPKPTMKYIYYRDFPTDYDVYGVEYIMTRQFSASSISGIILDYVRQKKLEVETVESKSKFNKTPNYIFRLAEGFRVEDISNKIESELLDWLINKIGNSRAVSLEQIKTWCEKNSSKGEKQFEKLKEFAKEMFEDKMYEKKSNNFRGTAIYFGFSFHYAILYFIVCSYYKIYQYCTPCIFFILIFFIATIILAVIKRPSQYAVDERNKLKGLKKFMKDFGTFSEKELPEIILWERYLVYATVLGVARKLERTMRVKMPETDNSAFVILGTDSNFSSSMSSSFTNSISSGISSSMSSAGGSGGGASGGGGSGGGGRRRWRILMPRVGRVGLWHQSFSIYSKKIK